MSHTPKQETAESFNRRQRGEVTTFERIKNFKANEQQKEIDKLKAEIHRLELEVKLYKGIADKLLDKYKVKRVQVPDNEFTEQCTGDMPTADSMYAAYQQFYNKCVCRICGEEFWIKKPGTRDLCNVHVIETMFPNPND